MNLTSAQLDGLKANKDVDLIEGTSLDFVYMTLTSGKELSPALAIKEALRPSPMPSTTTALSRGWRAAMPRVRRASSPTA
jgi:hypothetical protein